MNRIIIFVKAPVAGTVKTRLCPPLSYEQAATLYQAFVRDTMEAARGVAGARIEVAYQAGEGYPDLGWLETRPDMAFLAQKGSGLGERIIHAFDHAFQSGAQKTVVLGSDTPQLNSQVIQEAFHLLDGHDVVLGPAADGGYYLVGLKKPARALFEGVSWSTARVYRQTLGRVENLGLSHGLLPEYRDMDTFADLEALSSSLAARSREQPRFTLQALRCNIPPLLHTHVRRRP